MSGVVVSEDANEVSVADAIRSMATTPEDDAFVVLSQSDDTYLQAGVSSRRNFWLEYQAGSIDQHYDCAEDLDEAALLRAFSDYLRGDPRWRGERTWTKAEDLAPPSGGRLALHFDTLGLVLLPGMLGILPAGIWFAAALFPLSFVDWPNAKAGPFETALLVPCGVLGAFIVFVGPALAAGLVQRARQPSPARVEWDDEGIVEWNGQWRRTVIPWSRLEVAWQKQPLRSGASSALQLRDRETRALIHVWNWEPPGVRPVRRRIYASTLEISALVEALEAHDPEFARARAAALETHDYDATVGAPDWSLAADRWEPRWVVRLGRFGYLGAVVAPLLAIAPPGPSGIPPATFAAAILAVIAAALLALRAEPVRREWLATGRELAALPAAEPRAEALTVKRRAIRMELILRSTFVAMTLYATVASALFSRMHP